MMLDDFEMDYRKREVKWYQDRLDEGKLQIEVPTQSVIKMLAENLSLRARLDYMMEQIMRHNFAIPQRIIMPLKRRNPGCSDCDDLMGCTMNCGPAVPAPDTPPAPSKPPHTSRT